MIRFGSMWTYGNQRTRSVTYSEVTALKHLQLLAVNPGTVIVWVPTMDSTLECFKWAVQNVKNMDMEIHRLSKR
jgi:hypothetical protein